MNFKLSTAIPYSYILVKNKSNLKTSEVKVRTIFSYSQHPLKKLSSLIGRCLTVFIKELAKALPCCEMCSMDEVVPYNKEVESLLLQKQQQDKQGIKGRWMELDIKDMFPSINKTALREALTYIYKKFILFRNKRVRTEIIFSIHKKYRALDDMRSSLHKEFYQFSWSEVLIFVLWDLQCNNMFYCRDKLFFSDERGTHWGTNVSPTGLFVLHSM